MQLLFSSASLLGLNYEFEFIGGNFNFRNRKDLSIEGDLLALTNFSGVEPIWSGISGVISNQKEYSNIILNGTSFGSGRLNSISFEPGLDVRRKRYSASFSVYSSGNISNMNQSGYSGLYSGFNSNNFKNVASLSESFDFERNPDRTYSYNRQLDIELQSGNSTYCQKQAKEIASFIFGADITFPFINSQYPNFYEASGRKLYSENYDLISNKYSFTELFTFQSNQDFSWTYSHSVSLSENGENTITEKGQFKGVATDPYSSALSAFDANFPSHYSRCNAIMSYYYPSCSLQSSPISITIDRDIFLGTISYTVVFSNSPKYLSTVIWDYSYNCERQDGYFNVIEDGSVIGLGDRQSRHATALNFYNSTVVSGISSRMSGYYTNFKTLLNAPCTATLNEDSRSVTDSEYDGSIRYNMTYSTDSRLRSFGVASFINSSESNSMSVPIVNIYKILGDSNSEYAAPVYRGNSNLGNYKFDVNLISATSTQDLNSLVSIARSQINKSRIPASEYYLKDVSYNYNYNNRAFDFSATFDYVRNRGLNDIRIV